MAAVVLFSGGLTADLNRFEADCLGISDGLHETTALPSFSRFKTYLNGLRRINCGLKAKLKRI